MAIDPINISISANDGNGDPLRTAYDKINKNESDLDTRVDAAQSAADDAQATADAAVKDINGLTPESDGSVTLDADDVGAIASSEKAVANGVASLDDNGIVPQTQLPPFVLSVNNNEPDSAGDVEISASDVGLGNVDNTSDADKPVSDATQTALNAKANASDVVYSVNGNDPDTNGNVDVDWGDIGGTLSDQSDLKTALDAKANALSVTTSSATSYTAVLADAFGYRRMTADTAVTYTVPPNSDVAFPIGTVMQVQQAGNGEITFAAGSGVTLNARSGRALLSAAKYGVINLVKKATDEWDVYGDLAPISFSAHRAGFAQNSVPNNSTTQVEFPATVWNVEGYFSTTTYNWTPPAGTVRLNALVTGSAGVTAGSTFIVLIRKNGITICQDGSYTGTGASSWNTHVSCLAKANGTDTFGLYVFISSSSTSSLDGAPEKTFFQGEML